MGAGCNGLRGETETVDKMSARVKFDIDYLNQWSLWMDIKILVRTVLLVVLAIDQGLLRHRLT